MSTNPTRPVLLSILIGVLSATAYGVATRWMAESGFLFGVMSVGFLFGVPAVMGVISVLPLKNPTLAQAATLPVISVLSATGIAMLFNWEGLICVAMALIPLLMLAALAGLIMWCIRVLRADRNEDDDSGPGLYAIALLPFLLAQIEKRFDAPLDQRVVRSEILIAATPEEVWEQIVEVRTIEESEHRPALFTAIGFPRPISAMVDRRALGGVREARFEGGVLFLEEITRFEPGRALEFTIDAQEHLIPPTTLDPHVTIGGPFFDVLIGAYEIEPIEHGVVLHLKSELRVSTHFNFYASRWADLVMGSIQDNILGIIKRRAEE